MSEQDPIVRQLSVFLDNRPGSLGEVLRHLADHSIDLCALSVAESRDFGTMRIIVPDTDAAAEALAAGDFHYCEVDVLAVVLPDRPGGMAEVAEKLAAEHINIEYTYIMVVKRHDEAVAVVRVSDLHRAAEVLKGGAVHLLTASEVAKL